MRYSKPCFITLGFVKGAAIPVLGALGGRVAGADLHMTWELGAMMLLCGIAGLLFAIFRINKKNKRVSQ